MGSDTRRMLAQALEAEVADYIARNQERDAQCRAKVVRNGKASARKVTLGSGTIEVRAPRVDDRRKIDDGSRRRFRSHILPPYMRRSPKVSEVLPILYLRGLSTADFKEGLAALLGEEASGLSPTAIARLTGAWQADYGAKYPKAVASLRRDEAALLAFFDSPAEHWVRLRTGNVIESPFATMRLRQRVTKGAESRQKGLLMAFQLLTMAERRWRRVNCPKLLPFVHVGAVFRDGLHVEPRGRRRAA